MNNLFVRFMQMLLPRRFWYRKFYLRSKHWQQTRRRKLESAGYACQRCRRKTFLDVHHLTYNLWNERQSELKALCRSCHEKQH